MVDGRPTQFSAEGKIGISLTLLGLFGAGAIAVAPDQVWIIGWTLIAIAVIGLVLLFLYHVATYRRPHGQAAASMMPSMTLADIGFNVAIAAAIIAWLAAFWRRRTVAIIAAVIACGFLVWAISGGHFYRQRCMAMDADYHRVRHRTLLEVRNDRHKSQQQRSRFR
jgi:hypothetical protein